MKRLLALALAAVVATGSLAAVPADAYTDSSLGSKLIGRVGSSTKSVSKGSEFDLEVRKGTKVRENDIKWTIGNTSVVKFDDDDRYDDEIELKAVGTGTTKVTANNLLTGGKIAYTVTVKNSGKTISRIGNANRSVREGSEFELEVQKNGGIQDKDLYWYTSDSDIVRVDDDDRSNEEIELRAVSPGKVTITCKNQITGGKVYYYVTVEKSSKTISRIGNANRTVDEGDEFELEVRKNGGIQDKDLYWYTSDSDIVRVDDDDRTDEEIELRAVSPGKATITCKNQITGGKVYYYVTVDEAAKLIYRVGNKTKSVEVGDDLELEVRKSGLKESQIKWSIDDTDLLRFEDGDNYGSEVELEARRTGSTTVTAKNLVTGGEMDYIVKIVPDYDDEWDD